jgi:hypothetical protein
MIQRMIGRIAGLTLRPAATFVEIARAPEFLAAWLVSSVLFAAPMLVAAHRIGMIRLLGNAEGLEDFADAIALLFQFLVIVTPLVTIPLTAVCLIPMVKAMRGTAPLRPLLAVTAYAALPPALGICITALLVMVVRDPAKLSLESLAPLNLGLLIPAKLSGVLHNIASTIELFSAWSIVLLSHGVATASGLSFWRVFLALAVPLILFAWALALLAAML